MGAIQNMMIGALMFMAIITGWYFGFNDLFSRTGATMPATYDASVYNNASNYLSSWTNQTQTSLSNAQAIPFFGGSFMLLTGVFQSLTLMVGMIPNVIMPLFNGVSQQLGVAGWFIAFATAAILISVLTYLLNAMKGSQV